MDAVRVQTPESTKEVVIGNRVYDANRGEATIYGRDAVNIKKSGENWLPERTYSLRGSPLPELVCTFCGRHKFAFYGPVCAWCYSECVPLTEGD